MSLGKLLLPPASKSFAASIYPSLSSTPSIYHFISSTVYSTISPIYPTLSPISPTSSCSRRFSLRQVRFYCSPAHSDVTTEKRRRRRSKPPDGNDDTTQEHEAQLKLKEQNQPRLSKQEKQQLKEEAKQEKQQLREEAKQKKLQLKEEAKIVKLKEKEEYDAQLKEEAIEKKDRHIRSILYAQDEDNQQHPDGGGGDGDGDSDKYDKMRQSLVGTLSAAQQNFNSNSFHEFGVSDINHVLELYKKYPNGLVNPYDLTTKTLLQFNLKNNLEAIQKHLQLDGSVESWHSVGTRQLRLLLHQSFHSIFDMPLWEALSLAYPDVEWRAWCFSGISKDSKQYLKAYLEWFAKKNEIKHMDDWYVFKTRDYIAQEGSKFIYDARGSVMYMLSQAFPNHHWLEWRFASTSRSFWRDQKNLRAYMDWLGGMLNVKNMDDWYAVRPMQLKQYGGASLLVMYNTLPTVLESAYPDHIWEPELFKPFSFNKRDVPASASETVYVEGRLPGDRVSRRRTFAQLEQERRRQGLEKELFYKPSPFSNALPSTRSTSTPPPIHTTSTTPSPLYNFDASPLSTPSLRPSLKVANLPPLPESAQSTWDILDTEETDGVELEKDGEEDRDVEDKEDKDDDLEEFDIDPLLQDFGDEDSTTEKKKRVTATAPTPTEAEEEDELGEYDDEGDITEDAAFGSSMRLRSPSIRPSKTSHPSVNKDSDALDDTQPAYYENDSYYENITKHKNTTNNENITNFSSTPTTPASTTNINESYSIVTEVNPMEDISEDEFEVDPFEGEDSYSYSAEVSEAHITPPISPPSSFDAPIPPPTVFSSTTLEAEAEVEADEMDQNEIDKLDEIDASEDGDGEGDGDGEYEDEEAGNEDDDGAAEDGSEFLEDGEFEAGDEFGESEFEFEPSYKKKGKQ